MAMLRKNAVKAVSKALSVFDKAVKELNSSVSVCEVEISDINVEVGKLNEKIATKVAKQGEIESSMERAKRVAKKLEEILK